jgi:hypothetical protein
MTGLDLAADLFRLVGAVWLIWVAHDRWRELSNLARSIIAAVILLVPIVLLDLVYVIVNGDRPVPVVALSWCSTALILLWFMLEMLVRRVLAKETVANRPRT